MPPLLPRSFGRVSRILSPDSGPSLNRARTFLVGLGIFWVVVGVVTMGTTSTTFKTCDFTSTALNDICSDGQTLAVWSLVTAALRELSVCDSLPSATR